MLPEPELGAVTRLPAQFTIGERSVGGDSPAYVIAEAGANHNRDMAIARELIDVAADAGADAIKFQTYSGDKIYSRKTPRFEYLAPITDKAPSELLEDISLPRDWQQPLAAYAAERGIAFFSTPFDHEAVDELASISVPVLKIASFELVDLLLIEKAAATGIPLILSTGMARLGEIEEALTAATAAGATAVALLQCTSLYPAPAELANLRAIATMRAAFGVPVGLSDHTTGLAVPIAAATLGAAIIEKHFTLDRTMAGPDHPFAIEPDELRMLVAGVRDAQAALGTGRKDGPSDAERKEMYVLARRSLIMTRDLPAGTRLERDMLTVKRPGLGIAPKYLSLVLGRELKTDVEEDDILTWEMV